MIVGAGHLQEDPDSRASYLDDCHEVVSQARAAAGCLDFALSGDLVDPGRINVFERWETVDDVEAFRGSGPSDDQTAQICTADVRQFFPSVFMRGVVADRLAIVPDEIAAGHCVALSRPRALAAVLDGC